MSQLMTVSVGFNLYSDHIPFTLREIPTASLRGGVGFTGWSNSRGWGHPTADPEDELDVRDIREAAVTLARILIRMVTMDELPLEKKSKAEIRSMLPESGYAEVMSILRSYPSWLE